MNVRRAPRARPPGRPGPSASVGRRGGQRRQRAPRAPGPASVSPWPPASRTADAPVPARSTVERIAPAADPQRRRHGPAPPASDQAATSSADPAGPGLQQGPGDRDRSRPAGARRVLARPAAGARSGPSRLPAAAWSAKMPAAPGAAQLPASIGTAGRGEGHRGQARSARRLGPPRVADHRPDAGQAGPGGAGVRPSSASPPPVSAISWPPAPAASAPGASARPGVDRA